MSDQAKMALDMLSRMASVSLPPKTGMVIILAEAEDGLGDGFNSTLRSTSNMKDETMVAIVESWLEKKKQSLANGAS